MYDLQVQPELLPFIHGQQVRLKESCWINNEPHFTRRAIGEWLEYAPKIRDRAISKIIERNPYIDQFSVLVNLTSADGKNYDQKVYNQIGLQLIVFESHQPKAKACKIAVAHLVQAVTRGEVKPPKRPGDLWLQLACEDAATLFSSGERGNAVRAITEKYNVHRMTVYRWIKRIEQGENPSERKWGRHIKGSFHYLKQETIDLMYELIIEDPKITAREIIRRLPCVDCSAIGTVYKIKRQALKDLGTE